jgi:hypothetical protein
VLGEVTRGFAQQIDVRVPAHDGSVPDRIGAAIAMHVTVPESARTRKKVPKRIGIDA